MTSPSCNTFNYNLNTDISARGSYIDLFEAMADCNTCPNSFAKIVGTF